MSAFESVDRLEGSKNETGGLIIKKKIDDKDSKFKRPSESLLGLKKLADEKRKQRNEEERSKRGLEESPRKDTEDESSKTKKQRSDERHYRSYKPETPSHPGGVNEEAKAKIKERHERHKDKGVHADSRDLRKKWKENDRDRFREHRVDERRDRSGERRSQMDRSDRKYDRDRDRKSERSSSTRRGYEQWEDTPSRSRRSDGGSERATPRITPKGIFCSLILLCDGRF